MHTVDDVLLEENTRRLIARATTLGYHVNLTSRVISVEPTNAFAHTLAISQEDNGTWVVEAHSHPCLTLAQTQSLIESYQRAAAMIDALQDYHPEILAPYHG